ncbi:von Hippel-Lindau disease tumor suppressor isoform X1 [Leptopilina boulardi]|uniref:von Hippel-Lindau disease tumor suppressor isoform X1 n=1 Tax=Leptopilina boulardi TaxID=63433 RepID=UPI0021F55B74|nr:von Hippel-Lindau disease tumor suppressor isoform X1 [Leptopilina boulardi]XP_051159967.1 von Hippel-Lindau disease tumor suppressor isoform X1 [Leptopilina boulardi]
MEENSEVGLDRYKRPLRSINNHQPAYVRFCNTTHRHVRIYWLDFKGNTVRFSDLSSYAQWIDVNTFVTHPWIFYDEETGERLHANCQDVFYPEYRAMIANRIQRVNVAITLPVFSLKKLCLRIIKKQLTKDHDAFLLEIPRSLQYELAIMHPRLGTGETSSRHRSGHSSIMKK